MFNKSNFCHIASNNRNEQKGTVFIYKTTDTLDQVTQDGYFNEKLIDINIHDLIICVHIDPVLRTLERSMLIVTERTLENVNTQIATEVGSGSGGEIDPAILDKINNLIIAINAQIDANADAIQKTRDDYIAADSEIRQVLNNHESELTTLRGNQASLGDQVSGIEEKIPESASGTNHLVTKQMLLDKETDIRDDIAELEKKSGKTGKSLFDFKRTDYLLNDESWLHADTFSWQNGTKYSDAYNHLEADIEPTRLLCTRLNSDGSDTYYIAWPIENAKIGDKIYVRPINYSTTPAIFETDLVIDSEITITDLGSGPIYSFTDQNGKNYSGGLGTGIYRYFLETETVAGIEIMYHKAQDGHKICFADQDSNLSALYESTGIAWYYLLDHVNKQFKLPRTKWGFTGLRDSVGGYVEPGLPNVTGYIGSNVMVGSNATGAFKATNTVTSSAYDSSNHSKTASDASFDASRSNATYGNSDTVQPPATQTYLYFYVGEFSQTATEQTAGLNAEMFNNKADIDLGNIPANYDYVTESQQPTANNGYAWYRKYKSGWVEQGGRIDGTWTGTKTVTLPVPMQNAQYTATTGIGCPNISGMNGMNWITSKTSTKIDFTSRSLAGNFTTNNFSWQVSGMAA
jgi:hypothetical protein